MKDCTIFRRYSMPLAIMLALATSVTFQLAYAGAGWGDSEDIYKSPIKTPTYYANSPSGILPAEDCYVTLPPSSGGFNTATIPELAQANDPICDTGTALRKFVDPLPTLSINTVGTPSIPVAVADTTTYPGSDYYQIAVVDYKQRMHSDLAKETTLRGYVQLSATGSIALTYLDGSPIMLPNGQQAKAVAKPTYLGPIIAATSGRPTRLLFRNLLHPGAAGNLHIPVDETLTGAGFGPDGATKYQQNRVDLHLHGGDTPWISDGTPHQWILPAADEIALKNAGKSEMARGVGAVNVPDMPDPGPGAMTFYYPNGQSGRLMFYHDHALAITRLNVYAGLAAGYLINDAPGVGENSPALANLLGNVEQIPLIIQDKTFVPKNIALQDAKWDTAMGQEGDLWYPHVYETNQYPDSVDGTNPVGRWDWGPWFWPVFPAVYDLPTGQVNAINATTGLAEVSTTPEAFMDTAVVNGMAYPTLEVDPKAYRFRVLNAANDRFINLGLYLAADKQTINVTDPTNSANTVVCDGRARSAAQGGGIPTVADCTEVKMVPFNADYVSSEVYTPDGRSTFPTTGGITDTGWGTPVASFFPQGAPDPATAGPDIIQIGNEGGLVAFPMAIPSTPLNYEYNRRSATILNVQERGLYLGNAERADVLVDFSQYAGKTLILYNDAPAPVPASDPRVDYYTGNDDNTGVGGAPSTKPGYGPNTRTVMQIHVRDIDPTPGPSLTQLESALPQAYASSQSMPIIPEPEFNEAFNGTAGYTSPTARTNASIYTGSIYLNQYRGISFKTAESINFFPTITCNSVASCNTAVTNQQTNPVAPNGTTVVPNSGGLVNAPSGTTINAYVQNKAIQELFDPNYGRMNATLGVELPFTSSLTQTTIPLGYVDPATETVADGETQFWKITHNGVDTHPVHFHLVNLQVVNRVGWDGTLKPPYGDEIGWKETVKMNPLEDVIVAVRAKKPTLQGIADAQGNPIPSNAFGLPISERLMDPSQPVGSALGFTQIDPATNNPAIVKNAIKQYGWEYVWHCHILGHEENDFMRPVIFHANEVAAAAPQNLTVTVGSNGARVLSWTDVATTEYAYLVERGVTSGNRTTWTVLSNIAPGQQAIGVAPLANARTFTDTATLVAGTTYQYRVTAIGANGNGIATASYTAPGQSLIATPSNLTVTQVSTSMVLNWRDRSNNENNFSVWRSTNGGAAVQIATVTRSNTQRTSVGSTVTYTDRNNLVAGNSYSYYVIANKTTTPVASSAPSNEVTVSFAPPVPNAPSNTIARSFIPRTILVTWQDNSNNEAGFTIQRSTNSQFTTGVTNFTVSANVRTFTNTGLTSGTRYYYRVAATNDLGASAWSTIANTRAR